MERLKSIWKTIEHHRYTVVCPVIAGLVQLLVGGGLLGVLGDNVRKNGVIGGLRSKSS